MSANSIDRRGLSLPPYLWVWLCIVLAPTVYRKLYPSILTFIRAFTAPFFIWEAGHPIGYTQRLVHAHLLIPSLIIIIGLFFLAFPLLRKKHLERKYGLQYSLNVPILHEISSFVHSHSPGIQISNNLIRGDQVAFVYPQGFRKVSLALFGGIAKKWRRDIESAQAILLHELAHIKNGDALVTGAGSGIRILLNYSLVLIFATTIILQVTGDIVNFYDSNWAPYGFTPVTITTSFLNVKFMENFVTFLFFDSVPSSLIEAMSNLLFDAVVIIPLLMATWYAELVADHTAATIQGTSEPLIRALSMPSANLSRWRWLLAHVSHPPNRLRIWSLMINPIPNRVMFLILLFPMALIVAMLVYALESALFDLSVIWFHRHFNPVWDSVSTGTSIEYIATWPNMIYIDSIFITPQLIVIGIFIMLWPFIVKLWNCPRDENNEEISQWRRVHVIGGLITLLLAFLLIAVLIVIYGCTWGDFIRMWAFNHTQN